MGKIINKTKLDREYRAMLYNALAVTHDGRAVAAMVETKEQAFEALARWSCDRFYNGGKPLARFFIGSPAEGLAEYTHSEVIDKRNWR